MERMTDDFSNFLSLVSNIDEVALVATETQGESESEFFMPSGPVSAAKAAMLPEARSSRLRGPWALTTVVKVATPVTAR